MVPQPRAGSFSPHPAPTLQAGAGLSPLLTPAGALSAGASPSASSPATGSNSLIKIAVAQVYLLLSSIKEDRELQAEQLKKVRTASDRSQFLRLGPMTD